MQCMADEGGGGVADKGWGGGGGRGHRENCSIINKTDNHSLVKTPQGFSPISFCGGKTPRGFPPRGFFLFCLKGFK